MLWPLFCHACSRQAHCWACLPVSNQPQELRPEPPFTGVSGPSGPEIAKKVSKRVFWGVWRKVSKNTRKSPKYMKASEDKSCKLADFSEAASVADWGALVRDFVVARSNVGGRSKEHDGVCGYQETNDLLHSTVASMLAQGSLRTHLGCERIPN